VLLLLVGYVVGMFYGDIKADGGGLDILSFNLNGFWNPGTYLSHYGKRTFDSSEFVLMNYSNLLPALGLFREYQNEGFAYLGVGVLLLLLITGIGILGKIVLAGKTKRLGLDRKSGSYLAALIIYVVVFVYLALSPRWTWGTGELFYISYPQKIFQLLSIFRSTGRFIWPVYYLLIALGCIGIIKVLQNRSVLLKLILVVLVLVQLYDLLPGFEEKREAFSKDTPYTTVLQSEVWQYLGENGEEIIFYPPTLQGLYYDCKTSMEFEIYALQYGLSLNMTYMSRDLTEVADRRTLEHFSERAQGLRDDKAIYIFFDCVRDELPSEEETGLHYYEIDGYIVGTELDLSQFSLQKLE
jgi:hypothetical protein